MSIRAATPLLLFPVLGLLAGGCGVAEYEKKMLEAQNRLQRFDEEKRVLGAPLNLPRVLDENQVSTDVANLFLRPPHGISENPSNDKEPRERLFYSYPPATGKQAGGFTLVELAFGDVLRDRDFAQNVLRCFSATGGTASRTNSVQAPGRAEPVTFQTTEFEDGQYFYSVNVWRGSKQQVAVAYWVLREQKAAARRALDLSLRTFAMDADATAARQLYQRAASGQLLKPPTAR
ncbi:MAG: hypothetical protein U0736_09180 [Gemmataceae bacterium]